MHLVERKIRPVAGFFNEETNILLDIRNDRPIVSPGLTVKSFFGIIFLRVCGFLRSKGFLTNLVLFEAWAAFVLLLVEDVLDNGGKRLLGKVLSIALQGRSDSVPFEVDKLDQVLSVLLHGRSDSVREVNKVAVMGPDWLLFHDQ